MIFEVSEGIARASSDVTIEIVLAFAACSANRALERFVVRVLCTVVSTQIGSFWGAVGAAEFLTVVVLNRHRAVLASHMATVICFS